MYSNGRCRACAAKDRALDRQRHPESWRIKRARHKLKHRYGMSPADYAQMLQAQAGRCAICGTTMRRPHVDHDHSSQAVRGLLCADCNHGLGNFRDDLDLLQRAIAYLAVWKP